MESDCRNDPPVELLKAIEQFNAGEYFECHETLEDLWKDEPARIRNLYKGILQIGVAIHHAKRSNLRGALRLISSGMELVSQFLPLCLGIDTALLTETAMGIKEELERLHPGEMLPPEFTPKIRLAP